MANTDNRHERSENNEGSFQQANQQQEREEGSLLTEHSQQRSSSASSHGDPDDDDMYPPPQTSRPLSSQQLHIIRALPSNNVCMECDSPSQPDWASVTYGIVLCLDCAGIHRGLGVHLSFVRSLTMDDWTDDQFRRMNQGGNARWKQYWETNCSKNNNGADEDGGNLREKIRFKYESNIARAYREALSINTKASRSWSANATPSPSNGRIHETKLPDEYPPSFSVMLKGLAWPFTLTLFSSGKSRLFLLAWGMLGITGSYAVRRWGLGHGGSGVGAITSSLPTINPVAHSYMGVTTATSTASLYIYYNMLALGILALTAGIPCFLLRKFAIKLTHSLLDNRQEAFKSARNLLVDRIGIGRSQRMKRCDVYYPAKSEDGKLHAQCGLILYPRSLVDRAAYAPIATRLSELGILVAVPNLEPYRFVGNLRDYALKEEVMHILSGSVLLSKSGVWTVDEWAIGGHSAGGHLAIVAVTNEFSSTIKKVVLYGVLSYPNRHLYPHTRTLRDTNAVSALVVNGSNDGIIKGMANTVEKFHASMPPKRCNRSVDDSAGADNKCGHTYHVTIEGGNHAGCAHYGPQMFPCQDGVRTITLEQQQRQTAEATADFLLNRVPKNE